MNLVTAAAEQYSTSVSRSHGQRETMGSPATSLGSAWHSAYAGDEHRSCPTSLPSSRIILRKLDPWQDLTCASRMNGHLMIASLRPLRSGACLDVTPSPS